MKIVFSAEDLEVIAKSKREFLARQLPDDECVDAIQVADGKQVVVGQYNKTQNWGWAVGP